jgi:uncharacterized membrane protein YeaQ/YmgE (transglycosylase-associated protein family)
MNGFEFTPNMLIVVAAAAFGGLMGGLLTGRRATAVGSILMGTIGGIVTTVLIKAADFPPIVEVAGYSIVYAVLGGIVLSAIIGYSSR